MLVHSAAVQGDPAGLTESEALVARLLRAIDEPGAMAFHSVLLRDGGQKREAEIDFLVIFRGALIVLEVKGGTVRRRADGQWELETRRYPVRSIEAPFSQAKNAKFALRNLLKSLRIADPVDALVEAVYTPFSVAPPANLGWRASQWLDRSVDSPEALHAALGRLAADAREPFAPRSGGLRSIVNVLGQEFIGMAVYDAQRKMIKGDQDRLTEEQVSFLLGVQEMPRAIIQAGAGTGKTVALCQLARRADEAGDRVLLTFHSPFLVEMMRDRMAGTGVAVKVAKDVDATTEQYDLLLVDEAQDLMNEDAMMGLAAALDGGIDRGRWVLGLDANNQSHVAGRFDPEWYDAVREGIPTFPLSRNVRNTIAMVADVQSSLLADIGTPTIANGAKVTWPNLPAGGDTSARLDRLAEALKARADEFGGGDCVIISVAGDGVRDPAMLEENELVIAGVPCISPAMAKGLEFEHVLIIDVPTVGTHQALSGLYVAMTRARVSLAVAISDEARGWMAANAAEFFARGGRG